MITGLASLFSYLEVEQDGLRLSKLAVSLLTLVVFALLFVVVATVTEGWRLYLATFVDLRVVAVQKSGDHELGYIVLLSGSLPVERGTLLELRRPLGDAEATFGFIELLGRTAAGYYQRP